MSLFQNLSLERIQNESVLRVFQISIRDEGDKIFFRFERTYQGNQLVFYISPIYSEISSVWNMLESKYYPCAATILTKLGKFVFDFFGTEEEQWDKLSSHRIQHKHCFESSFSTAVFSSFVKDYITFESCNTTYRVFLKCRRLNPRVCTNNPHLLIQYFITRLTSGFWDADIFKYIKVLFHYASNTENGANELLDKIRCSVTASDFFLEAVYISSDEGEFQVASPAIALAAHQNGDSVLGGSLSLSDLSTSQSTNLSELLQPLELPTITSPLTAFRGSLTPAPQSSYNEEVSVPHVSFWNI